MTKIPTVNIHGKEYVTVATRVNLAHAELKALSIITQVLVHEPIVVVKASVTTPKGNYTGISAANPSKLIEKQNPYEVAETSAVGRALGFAGYGSVESIASADEVEKALTTPPLPQRPDIARTATVTLSAAHQKVIRDLLYEKGYTEAQLRQKYDVTDIKYLTMDQFYLIAENLRKQPTKIQEPELNVDDIPEL